MVMMINPRINRRQFAAIIMNYSPLPAASRFPKRKTAGI